MTNMAEKVIAVVDAQGFYYGSKFIPREFAFVCDDCALCYEIVPNISNADRTGNMKTFFVQEHYVHGIPMQSVLNDGVKRKIDESRLLDLITALFEKYKVDNSSLLGVKNNQFYRYLMDNYRVPLFNYDHQMVGSEFCPSLVNFDKYVNNYFCPLHSQLNIRKQSDYRCSLRKCIAIFNWQKNKIISDDIFTSVDEKWYDASSELEPVKLPEY